MRVASQQLTGPTIDALEALAQACQQADGHHISIYRDLLAQHRPKPQSVLYYDKTHLIGFAAVFFFEHDTGEISVLVHPEHRHRGIAHALLQPLLEAIEHERPVDTLVFSTPRGVYDNALLQCGFHYQKSEYDMQRELCAPLQTDTPLLHVRDATEADMDALCVMDNLCFPHGDINPEARFQAFLTRPQYRIVLALHNNKIIGKAHLAWHAHSVHLSDIAILPTHQRQGFGRALINHCLLDARKLPHKTATLSVETGNQQALQLYLGLGFSTNNAIDYWSCAFQTVKQYLK